MKYLSVLFLVIATLLSCDKDASEKSEKSDDDKKDTKLTLCDCLESKNKKDGDDLTAWYNSENGKHCDKLLVDADDGAEAECNQGDKKSSRGNGGRDDHRYRERTSAKGKEDRDDERGWFGKGEKQYRESSSPKGKSWADDSWGYESDGYDDYGYDEGDSWDYGGYESAMDSTSYDYYNDGYDDYGYDEGDSWGYESKGYDDYGYDEDDSWGYESDGYDDYGDYDYNDYGYESDDYNDYGYLDGADDACSCVESLTSLIYNVDSYWDLENLESTIKRELPQCDDIMEDSRVENYLDRNCPYAEEDLMEALEYVSMKFNPVE